MFVGQAARDHLQREAFQEVDYGQMFGKFAKWVTQIDDPARIPELVGRAFHVAVNGRPGPVVVAIPEDVLMERCQATPPAPFKRVVAAPSAAALAELELMIAASERPLLVLGGGSWNAEAVRQMQAFAERLQLPATVGFRCQDLFDNTHPNYVGDLGLGVDPALVAMVQTIGPPDRGGRAPRRGEHEGLLAASPFRGPRKNWCTCTRALTSSVSSTRPTC